MARRFFTNELADYYVNLITANIAGLKIVAQGDVSMLPGPKDLASTVPGVIIEPQRLRSSPLNLGRALEVTYPFRLYYFRQYSGGEDVAKALATEAQNIAELIFTNFELPGFSQPNVEGVHGYPTALDLAPAENQVMQQVLEVPISVATIDIEIYTRVGR